MVFLSLISLVIAGIFAVFVPNKARVNATTGWRYFVVRWFHSLVWICLAVAFLMQATENETLKSLATVVGALGGLSYLVYVMTFSRLNDEPLKHGLDSEDEV
jgi:hypothetical protein